MHSLLLALFAIAAAPAGEPVHGMTVSCPTWGWEWGTDAMATTLDDLGAIGVNWVSIHPVPPARPEIGVNWVSIHPYAGIGADGSVRARDLDPENPPVWLTRPIAEAHARGMRVLVKPHLAYWGSPFAWRGEIAFEDPEARERFFAQYAAWVVAVARITASADAFAVGTELDATVRHEDAWRQVIAGVRAVFPGHLTYAANWTDHGKVPFWDAVDAVGVQAYFPLVDDGTAPDPAALEAGWARVMAEMRALHVRTGKPVVFTELGYTRAPQAASRPWEAADHPAFESLQTLCLDAALKAVAREPAVVGAFLWKWMPGTRHAHDFAMSRPAAREVISTHFGG